MWHLPSFMREHSIQADVVYVCVPEDGEYAEYLRFEQRTQLNGVILFLKRGCWYRVAVTNRVFRNWWSCG